MSFLTYHLNYYTEELQKLESCDANQETIYHAKQLLKILDDLQDEGYTELQQQLEMNGLNSVCIQLIPIFWKSSVNESIRRNMKKSVCSSHYLLKIYFFSFLIFKIRISM